MARTKQTARNGKIIVTETLDEQLNKEKEEKIQENSDSDDEDSSSDSSSSSSSISSDSSSGTDSDDEDEVEAKVEAKNTTKNVDDLEKYKHDEQIQEKTDDECVVMMAGLVIYLSQQKLNKNENNAIQIAKHVDNYCYNVLKMTHKTTVLSIVMQDMKDNEIMSEDNEVTNEEKSDVKNDAETCDFVFVRNSKLHNKGEVCGQKITKNGKCGQHQVKEKESASASKSEEKKNEKKTEEKKGCDEVLKSGKNQGKKCDLPVKNGTKCGRHSKAGSSSSSENDEKKKKEDSGSESEISSESFADNLKPKCKHFYPKKKEQCDQDAVMNGLCVKHKDSKTFVQVKADEESEADSEYFGDSKKNKETKEKDTKKEKEPKETKPKKQAKPCKFVLTRGKNSGQKCGKDCVTKDRCKAHEGK